MRVEQVNTVDFYPIMKSWWEGHNFPIVSLGFLPYYTFVCYNEKDVPVYSMCFYNTDSHLCWIGWQISNPEVSKEETKGCFKYLFEEAEKHAKKEEYTFMFTTSKNPSVEATLKNTGYEEGDTNVNHYIKIL